MCKIQSGKVKVNGGSNFLRVHLIRYYFSNLVFCWLSEYFFLGGYLGAGAIRVRYCVLVLLLNNLC